MSWSRTGITGLNPSHKFKECLKKKAFYFYYYYNGFLLKCPTFNDLLLGIIYKRLSFCQCDSARQMPHEKILIVQDLWFEISACSNRWDYILTDKCSCLISSYPDFSAAGCWLLHHLKQKAGHPVLTAECRRHPRPVSSQKRGVRCPPGNAASFGRAPASPSAAPCHVDSLLFSSGHCEVLGVVRVARGS